MGLFERFFGRKNNQTPEDMLRTNIQNIGLHSFPDDEGAHWNIDSIEFQNGMYIVVTSPGGAVPPLNRIPARINADDLTSPLCSIVC